jgi:hypothetical protein
MKMHLKKNSSSHSWELLFRWFLFCLEEGSIKNVQNFELFQKYQAVFVKKWVFLRAQSSKISHPKTALVA